MPSGKVRTDRAYLVDKLKQIDLYIAEFFAFYQISKMCHKIHRAPLNMIKMPYFDQILKSLTFYVS